jgi:hypothetical protein
MFIGCNPGTARPVTRIHSCGGATVVNLRRLSRSACDSFVAIHRKQIAVATSYDTQSAHKPNASRFRAGLNRRITPIAALPSSHGANSTRAITSQGSNLRGPDDALGMNRQMAKIAQTQTAEQTAVVLANSRTGSRNAPAAT